MSVINQRFKLKVVSKNWIYNLETLNRTCLPRLHVLKFTWSYLKSCKTPTPASKEHRFPMRWRDRKQELRTDDENGGKEWRGKTGEWEKEPVKMIPFKIITVYTVSSELWSTPTPEVCDDHLRRRTLNFPTSERVEFTHQAKLEQSDEYFFF